MSETSKISTSADSSGQSLELFEDVPLSCSVELGQAEITIRKLLTLQNGSILELGKLSEEPFDIKANGNLIARGEVVTVNDHYGVRITEIVDPKR